MTGFIGFLPIQWIFDLVMDINSVGSPHLQIINISSLTFSQYRSMNSFFFQPVIFCTPLFIPHMHIGQLLLTLPPITSTSSPFFDFQTIVARVIPKL